MIVLKYLFFRQFCEINRMPGWYQNDELICHFSIPGMLVLGLLFQVVMYFADSNKHLPTHRFR